MPSDLRIRIGLSVTRSAVDRSAGPVPINEVLRWPKGLLAFLPRQPDEVPIAAREIERLASALQIAQVFMVRRAAASLGGVVTGTVLEWTEDDLGLFLPKRKATNRVLGPVWAIWPVDFAIDFNRGFCLPTTYWSVKSGARVRVGFRSAWSAHFLNLEYQPREDASAWEGCRGLADLLLMLSGRLSQTAGKSLDERPG
jgi:hypothetical protein